MSEDTRMSDEEPSKKVRREIEGQEGHIVQVDTSALTINNTSGTHKTPSSGHDSDVSDDEKEEGVEEKCT